MLARLTALAVLTFAGGLLAAAEPSSPSREEVVAAMRPYDGPSFPGVDRSTMTGKILCGYQGWFTTPEDGSDRGWRHYSARGRFKPGSCGIDLWPDVSELDDDEKCTTPFRHQDGRLAQVFSSHNRKTVLRHFQWMQKYGIDGVFLQRFGMETLDPKDLRHGNTVLNHCREGANRYGRCYAVVNDPALHRLIGKADLVSPWTVGRYRSLSGIEDHARQRWRKDLEWCREHGKAYLPVVFPGFSWHNQRLKSPLDEIPRLKGQFLWKQYVETKQAGAGMIYQAMFDEMDAGTAIFKCTNDPPVGASRFLTLDGLPSDHYLWLTGIGRKLLRGEIEATDALPQRETSRDKRPTIKKLGTLDLIMVETTPVVFKDHLYRFEYVRDNYHANKTGASYFRFIDVATDKATPAFAKGQHLGCAFVEGDTVYAFGVNKWGSSKITVFKSRDMKKWEERLALHLPGWELFNTSVCKADGRYVMAVEVGGPKKVVGVPFTIFFAESKDLLTWKLLPQECVYSKEKYTACPALRYLDGYFYMLYLETRPGPAYESHIVRSKDLRRWESSRLNPVMAFSDQDKRIANPTLTPDQRKTIAQAKNINNSDVDLCEFRGKTILYYSWGNQQGKEFLAEAVYEGTLASLLRSYFP